MRTGDIVEVRYLDHVFFKDSDESLQTPRLVTAIGRLSYQDDRFVRLKLEYYEDPDPSAKVRVRSMGLVIVKSTIVEIKRATA